MTKGWFGGASGGRAKRETWDRFWLPYLACLAFGVVIAFTNTTSELLEAARDDRQLRAWEPISWEVSSFILTTALTPAVAWMVKRLPPRRTALLKGLVVHAVATVPFSLVHVAGMVAIRKAVYSAAGSVYEFSHGVLPLVLLYEWRKDVLSYATIAGIFWGANVLADRRAAAAKPKLERIEIREDGRTLFVSPADIAWIEAAGNYVEIHAGGKPHLVRGTVAGFEAQLSALGFVRVHRSRLINPTHIRALKPTPAGDFEITLADGRSVLGSRRYRAALTATRAGV